MHSHSYDFDFLVIGAGSGGARAARIAASHGAKVAIVEKGAFGGTCVNVGCVPKKLFSYASHYSEAFEEAEGYGWSINKSVEKPVHNWTKLIKNKDREIERLADLYEKGQSKAEIFRGAARFQDPNTLIIGDTVVSADKILIATGGKPFVPDIPGKEHLSISDDLFYLNERPETAVIIGGGYIAVEFACILNGLGTEVTLLYRGDLFLKNFDLDLRTHIAEEMKKQGINIHFNTDVANVDKSGDKVVITSPDGREYRSDIAFAATGRVPNIDTLDLNKAGVTLNARGYIEVDKDYATRQPHIFAVGDCMNSHHLTPLAIAEGHYLADMLFAPDTVKKAPYPLYEYIPTAVFTNPPIGTVGLTQQEAEQKFGAGNIAIYKSVFKAMKHTLGGADLKTLVKLVVTKDTDQVVGLHMAGDDAAEILQGFALAVSMGAKKADFDRILAIHPTSAEELVTMRNPVN